MPYAQAVIQHARISYFIIAASLALVVWLHLGTLLLTSLFGYFALCMFSFGHRKLWSMTIYIFVITTIGMGLVYFSRQAYTAMPKIADTAIPAVVEFAERHGAGELPFTDYESLKAVAVEQAKEDLAGIGRYLRAGTFEVVMLVVGLVVAGSIFLNPSWDTEQNRGVEQNNLYTAVAQELAVRFRTFYESFKMMIGAQLVISIINTGFTGVFLMANSYPFTIVLISLTFLCGLLPIIGNLISNTLIVGVGFTVSPKTAFFALIFLVVIHKLEYFLNSKIIGYRIKNPMWLTLIGIVLGEKMMGIPGMILAPVVLHYIKVETSQSKSVGIVSSDEAATPGMRKIL